MSFGSDEQGGFNSESAAYKADPTLQNYLKLRRANPTAEIEVAVYGGFDSVVAMQAEFEAHGISIEQMMGILDADQLAISEVSLQLIDALVRSVQLFRSGETQLVRRNQAIPPKLIDWIIALMLEALSWNDSMVMNRDLIVLIRARLVGDEPHYLRSLSALEGRSNATWIGAQLIASGQAFSLRRVAKILGLSPSTVSRWFENGEFERECESLSKLFNADGSLKSLLKDDLDNHAADPK